MDRDRRPNFRPGWDVHPIQATRAFRDRDGMESVRLVAVRDQHFHLRRADGRITRHLCYRSEEVREFLTESGDLPALFSAAWRVLAVIVGRSQGEGGSVTALGASRMAGGAAVEMSLRAGQGRMLLFCVASRPVDPEAGLAE